MVRNIYYLGKVQTQREFVMQVRVSKLGEGGAPGGVSILSPCFLPLIAHDPCLKGRWDVGKKNSHDAVHLMGWMEANACFSWALETKCDSF